MAKVGQVYYNVIDSNSGGYISNISSIYEDVNIVTSYDGASQFNKLGIQAPPGTQVILNESKNIMIGRTGMYELDDDITIKNMYFVRPKQYKKDEDASAAMIEKGTADMLAANTMRQDALDALALDYPEGSPPQPTPESTEDEIKAYEAYWNRYNTIQSDYISAYQAALTLYNQGSNGIYILDEEAPPKELFNIIIDFIYE